MEFIKDLSVIFGLWVLFYNLGAWHREHKGKRNIELAEDILALFYEAVEVIRFIRHPASVSAETESIQRGEKESEREYEARKNASIVFCRYRQHKELFNKIYSMRYRFMAQIGKDKAKPFDELHQMVNEILLSARTLAVLWSKNHFISQEAETKHYERRKKHEAIFWEKFAEEDPINPRLDKVITDIEKTCQEVIMGKGAIHGFLNRIKIKMHLTTQSSGH
ncbi:MAG: hypothetical protein ABIE75_02025 [Candidatus Omnitrophota bacterium]